MKIPIKPMSVNKAWRGGRRYNTSDYKAYIHEVMLHLRPQEVPEGQFCLVLEFGVSNSRFDYDNGIKPFQDILQKKYGFDDNRIEKAFITKTKVKKGEEFIYFRFVDDLAIVAV